MAYSNNESEWPIIPNFLASFSKKIRKCLSCILSWNKAMSEIILIEEKTLEEKDFREHSF